MVIVFLAMSELAHLALSLVISKHAGCLNSFEHDQTVRLHRACALRRLWEARIYRHARDEMLFHGRTVGNYGYRQRRLLVCAIRRFAPELVAFGVSSGHTLNSIYGRFRVRAIAKMKRRVNLGSARRLADYS